LTITQKALRSFYEILNKLVLDHKAIHSVTSKLADLQYANHEFYDTKKIFSFIRYVENEEQLLFILNFDFYNTYDIQVAIPNEVWSRIGLDTSKTYILKEVFIDQSVQLELRANENLHLKLPNNQVYVFQIQPKP